MCANLTPVVFAWCYVPLDMQFCAPSSPLAHIRCCKHFGMEFTQCRFLDPCSEPRGATLLLWAEGADSCIILLLHLFWRFLFSSASSVAILMPRQKREMEWFNSNASVLQPVNIKEPFSWVHLKLLKCIAVEKQKNKLFIFIITGNLLRSRLLLMKLLIWVKWAGLVSTALWNAITLVNFLFIQNILFIIFLFLTSSLVYVSAPPISDLWL